MANKKLCRFCSEGFVPQRNEGICPKCSMEVSRAVSLPPGEPVFIDQHIAQHDKIDEILRNKPLAPETLKAINDEIKEPEKSPDIPEETKEILKEEVKEPEPEIPEPEPVIEAPEPEVLPEPKPEPRPSPEEDRKQKDVVNPTE